MVKPCDVHLAELMNLQRPQFLALQTPACVERPISVTAEIVPSLRLIAQIGILDEFHFIIIQYDEDVHTSCRMLTLRS